MSFNIIPLPQSLTKLSGEFQLRSETIISFSGPGSKDIAHLLGEYLRPATGFNLPVEEGDHGQIVLKCREEGQKDDAGFVDEDYHLLVSSDRIRCSATHATGLARGNQTLRQIFPPEIFKDQVSDSSWNLPCVEIDDAPRFRWRGQHLDVCRHFFSVEEVCKLIDLLALHRLNMCHLHLTEDQGWRIEIKKYPRLTEIGSVREATLIGHLSERPRKYDDTPYGGFFTQDDIKEIVEFASRRHITLVPEIDMPGHMVAAIAAYPELGNLAHPVKVRCHWGISQSILNVEESTVSFMKDVLDEVMDLFPGTFIHVGGDEAPKHEWSESRRAQDRMAELGLSSERQLQSWFIRQLDDHITQRGRRLIGWDEILEGGLAKGATVMSWRGEKGGLEAAQEGHDVVMCPQQFVYFDYYQAEPKEDEPLAIGGMTQLEKVYHYEPIPEDMDDSQIQHVLGSQGQLWTEYMPTMKRLEYMGFPRICALSEVLWLESEKKNYDLFRERLKVHRKRLDELKVNAHPKP